MRMESLAFEGSDDCLDAGCWPAFRPLLLSSPHSGCAYPKNFGQFALLGAAELTALNDGPVHQLLNFADAAGIPLLHARYARAVVDLNRSPEECLPFLVEKPGSRVVQVTARSQAGLGVVPTRIGARAIYDRALPAAELSWRIDELHAGYHQRLTAMHQAMVAQFGQALLLDMHSMPDGVARARGREVDVVLGNCHGKSCDAGLIHAAAGFLSDLGLRVSINEPYAGGYITQHHGRPEAGLPALQVELRRSLFLKKSGQLSPNAKRLSKQLAQFCLCLAQFLECKLEAADVDAA